MAHLSHDRNSAQSAAITDFIQFSLSLPCVGRLQPGFPAHLDSRGMCSESHRAAQFCVSLAEASWCLKSHRARCSVLHWLKPPGVVTFSLKEGLRHGFLSAQQLV